MDSQTVVTFEGNRTFNLLNGETSRLQILEHINMFDVEDDRLNIFCNNPAKQARKSLIRLKIGCFLFNNSLLLVLKCFPLLLINTLINNRMK